MTRTPASLLERLKCPGNQDAWQRMVQLYAPMIYHWARQAGLEENAAADLVQDVFVVLVQKLPEFHYDRTRSFRAWLKTVTLNKWREQMRGKRCDARGGDHALPEPEAADTAKVFEEADYRQFVVGRALRLVATDFEPATWQAWTEYVVEGRPAKDVAAELGLSLNAVYLAKSRVLCRLREELEGLLE